jgi:peptidoglycan/LPS O-acetylase OafA/YrhL
MGSLRLALALAVVCGHAGIAPFPGDTAVQGFYAISGFYMALVLNEKYGRGASNYLLFFSNRFMRLFPIYAVVLALTLVLAAIVPLPFVEKWHSSQPIDLGALIFLVGSQLLMVGQDLYSFLGLHGGALTFSPDYHLDSNPLYGLMPIPQSWTLGVELPFYALAPFIVRRSAVAIVAVIFASIALRLGLQAVFGFEGDPWSYRFFPSELALFLVGAIGYRVYRESNVAAIRWLMIVAVGVGTALLINRWHGATRVASVSALVVIFVGIPYLARWTQRIGADRLLGELSYPTYIGHVLVIWSVDRAIHLTGGARGLAILALTLTLSFLLYYWIDRPIDRWRQLRSARSLQKDPITELAIYSSR